MKRNYLFLFTVVVHRKFEGVLYHRKAMFLLNYRIYEAERDWCTHIIHDWVQIIFNNLPIDREAIAVKIYRYA